VGVAAFERTAEYVQNYVQGGRILIKHQAVALRLAEMATKLRAVRALLHEAARAVDERAPDAEELCNMVKLFASEEVFKVAQHAVELHGGKRYHARLRNREAVPRRGSVPAHGRDGGHLEVQDRQADVSAHGRRLRWPRGDRRKHHGHPASLSHSGSALRIAAQVYAQEPYASRPVKSSSLHPGSVTDIMARSVKRQAVSGLGQPVVVETARRGRHPRLRPGGEIGARRLHARSGLRRARGQSAIYDKLPYDSLKDFSGVIPLGNLPSVMFVSAGLGVKSVREFIALAKSKPGELNYSSAGVGSASHVNAEKFRVVTGINAVHIPMKGAPEMVSETIAGRTHFGFLGIAAALSAIRDGRLVGLAVSSAKRAPTRPMCRPSPKQACPAPSSISGSACLPPRRRRAPS